jgi:hypothetical protein
MIWLLVARDLARNENKRSTKPTVETGQNFNEKINANWSGRCRNARCTSGGMFFENYNSGSKT